MDNLRIKSDSFCQLETIKRTREYLKQYSVFRKLLEKSMRERKGFGNPMGFDKKTDTSSTYPGLIVSKMFEIKRFVLSMNGSDEKTLLFLHYVHGETLDSCAQRMMISERTARRIHYRALRLASMRLDEYISRINNTVCYE